MDQGASAVLNAANLRVGGGVQVASSVFLELMGGDLDSRFPWLRRSVFVASSAVESTLPERLLSDPRLLVFDAGRRGKRPPVPLADDAIWFDIFGGAIQRRTGVPRLVGFADVTSVLPTPWHSGRAAVGTWVRGAISRASFRSADRWVVETDALRARLVGRGFQHGLIEVVPNAYHPVFDVPVEAEAIDRWRCRLRSAMGASPSVLYVARGYSHKNHEFLGQVALHWQRQTTITPRFVVTLTDTEFSVLDAQTRSASVNVGPVPVGELPALYRAVDACFFPSRLESFSVMPLEALRSEVPLVAVKRDFVTDTVGDRALYYEEGDAATAAALLQCAVTSPVELPLEEWGQWVRGLDGSAQRAVRYASIIESMRTRSA